MPSIIYRLAEALLPDYEVERELASGGMGVVFLARDVQLDRMVAIKILRPELATAEATERFVREARTLANVRHSHVVPIHRAGEAGGFFYYVMDYVKGETLADRLRRGSLSRADAVKLGRDVLDALEAVHEMGVVHRDVKPSNIFLMRDRALLADFGISTSSGPQTAGEPGAVGVTGTPGYMPPEQAFGWEVTPRTDLYAFGMVLYQALTGRRWITLLPEEQPDWAGVPRSVLPILRRALAWNPADRWPDARTFRHRLWRTRTTKYRRRTLLLTLSGLVAGAAVVLTVVPRSPTAPTADLAIVPFEVRGGADTALGWYLANLSRVNLDNFLIVKPQYAITAWQDSAGEDTPVGRLPRALEVRYVATGVVEQRDGGVTIRPSVVDERGRVRTVGTVHWDSAGGRTLESVGARLALELAQVVAPDRYLTEYAPAPSVAGRSDAALIQFLQGERAFYGNAWRTAIGHYRATLALDSGFALASWRLAEAWRWLLTGTPPTEVDLPALLADHGEELGELDRRLIRAQLAPRLEERLRMYEEAVRDFPLDGYAAFLWGEEMMHRGALIGLSLDSAATLLEAATRKAPTSGPAWEHVLWVSLRLGREDAARQALDRFREIAAPGEEAEPYLPPLYELLYQGMFAQDGPPAFPEEVLHSAELALTLRSGAIFGAYALQAHVAEMLQADPRTDRRLKAIAAEGQGLALLALGRIANALQQLDSAASFFGTREAALQAAEWRVIPAALGVAGIPEAEVERGRQRLGDFMADGGLGVRAAWALALDAYAGGDAEQGARWRAAVERARPDTSAVRLAQQLEAIEHAVRGRWDLALEISEPLLALDSAGLRGGDPFSRAVLHWMRADWLDQLGRREEADASRRWYEHMIVTLWYTGEALPDEIDWALGPHAEFLRGRVALERGDDEAVCRHMSRVARLWTDPDEALRPLAELARERAEACNR
jgi:tetratricopeptide (TPR) repeat protein/predicted Ser/Thr protein kinase